MMNQDPGGALRLLQRADLATENPFGKPVVGWLETSQGEGGLYNPGGYAMLRVVVQKLINGEPKAIYDQPQIVEKLGAVVIPQLSSDMGGKIGFIESFRFNGDRIDTVDANYIKALNDEERWEELCASLGSWKYELPAGVVPAGTDRKGDWQDQALQIAKLEAIEEAGLELVTAQALGLINFNPTFFAHPQAIVHGIVGKQVDQSHEDLEIIGGKVHFFSPAEIREKINLRELDDGRSLSALCMAGIYIPR